MRRSSSVVRPIRIGRRRAGLHGACALPVMLLQIHELIGARSYKNKNDDDECSHPVGWLTGALQIVTITNCHYELFEGCRPGCLRTTRCL